MNASVLRLLDANFNRAREALRVMEDYARFVRADAELSGRLKSIRHDLLTATEPYVHAAIVHRDTPGDVGTTIKTPTEGDREGVSDVVTAAGKRLGEALRAIEEYLKTIDPAAAYDVESIRYRTYHLEQRIAHTLRPAACGLASVRLYVLITESSTSIPWREAALQAIEGGADCLQLREKGLGSGELLGRARDFVALCHEHRVISIINDRPDIAALSDADGVHVGQDDLPVCEVRKLLGRGKIVGVSTHTIEQARRAVTDGADYLGVGPLFRSDTKTRDVLPGLAFAKQAADEIRIPLVAIAGITPANIADVLATGLKAVAVTAAVIGSPDICAAARELKERLTAGAAPPPSSVGQAFLPVSPLASHPVPPVGRTFLSVSPPVRPQSREKFRRRNLPHWDLGDVTYFLTFRVFKGELDSAERLLVFDHILHGHNRFYRLLATVVMPDHAHLVIQPMNGYDLSQIGKGTKGVSARLVNEHRKDKGQVWQDETFDRIIRDQAELEEKLQYVMMNPVKRGLVANHAEYPQLFVLPNT